MYIASCLCGIILLARDYMKIEASVIDEWPVAGFMCLKSVGFDHYIGCQCSQPKSAVIACVRALRPAIVLIFVCIHVVYTLSRKVRMSVDFLTETSNRRVSAHCACIQRNIIFILLIYVQCNMELELLTDVAVVSVCC
jgi:hypothetical protein